MILLFIAGVLLGKSFVPSPPKLQPNIPVLPVAYPDNSNTVVFIRGERWGVWFGAKDEFLNFANVYGLTDCKPKHIFIENGLNYENQRDTFFHELLHAGACGPDGNLKNKYYNSETENGHEGIYKISQFTTELLHTNPELARYFAGQ